MKSIGMLVRLQGSAMALTLSVFCSSFASATTVTLQAGGDVISVLKPALYPETVVVNPHNGRFVLGSFSDGAIYEANDEGLYRVLVDDEHLHSVLGIAIDQARNRIYVADGDVGVSKRSVDGGAFTVAGLGVFDLTDGSLIRYVDLAMLAPKGKHLANGLTFDKQGNIYITDSFAPVIYKVDKDGKSSVFIKSDQFAGEGINLNGIVAHPDGYLLVIKKSDGRLFKIPLDKPSELIEVSLPLPSHLVGGDGLLLADNEELIVIANKASGVATNSVFSLRSLNGWGSANIIQQLPLQDDYPTTGTIKGNKLYVLQSQLDRLMKASPSERSKLKTQAIITPIGVVSNPVEVVIKDKSIR